MKPALLFPTLSLSALLAFPASGAVLTGFSTWPDPNVFLDIPNGTLAAITHDVANNELDFTTTGNTDMWTARNNAPIAWTSMPVVGLGETWYAETHVRYNGTGQGAQRVAGLTLWPGPDGTGGSGGGMDFSLGLNDWNDTGIEFQGWGNSGVGDHTPGNQIIANAGTNELAAHLRLEVTENGASDAYVGYWKANAGDAWTQFASFNSSVDASRVGLFFKNGNGTAAQHRSASFEYFNVAVIPEPSSTALVGLLGLGLVLRRRRK